MSVVEKQEFGRSLTGRATAAEPKVSALRDGIANATMRFGKYQGLLIADIITFNPQYLLWAEENLSSFVLSDEHRAAAKKERSKRYRASLERQNAWAWGFGGGAKRTRDKLDMQDIRAEQAARARAKAMEARQGGNGEAGAVHDSADPKGFAQGGKP